MFARFAVLIILTALNALQRIFAQNAYLKNMQKMGNVTSARILTKIAMNAWTVNVPNARGTIFT